MIDRDRMLELIDQQRAVGTTPVERFEARGIDFEELVAIAHEILGADSRGAALYTSGFELGYLCALEVLEEAKA